MRRRLLLVAKGTSFGGMQKVAAQLASGLSARGWDVALAVPAASATDEVRARFAGECVEPIYTEAVRPHTEPHGLPAARALRRLVADVSPTVVNIHTSANKHSLWDTAAVRMASRDVKLVTSTHSVPACTGRGALMTRAAARFAHGVTTVSNAAAASLAEVGVPRRRIEVLNNGVHHFDGPPSSTEARCRLGIGHDTFVVSTLARLDDGKGADVLIRAAADERLRGTTMLVAGDGPLRADLERQAAGGVGADVRFLGWVSDPAPLFAATDVFALPSDMESYGISLCEAAAAGLPIVATNVGGIPEVVADGQTGVLVPPQSPGAVADAVIDLRDDPDRRAELGAAGRDAVISIDTMCDHYEALYERLHAGERT